MFSVRVVDPSLCTGCIACMLACSFHHLSVYAPSRASIEALRDEKTGKVEIKIFQAREKRHIACDDCKGEKEKFCVKYCVRGVIA